MSEPLQTAPATTQTDPLVPSVHIGTVVHFVLPGGPEAVHGQCRPAIVVDNHAGPNGRSDLVAFHRPGDVFEALLVAQKQDVGSELKPIVAWEIPTTIHVGIPYDPTHEFGSWHPIDQCRVRP